MTRHLSPREVIDAVDERLDERRRGHLAECPACRSKVAEMREVLEVVGEQTPVPDPSPLFWDHLQARVRERTSSEPTGPRVHWWSWQSLAVASPVLIAAILAVIVVREAKSPGGEMFVPAPASRTEVSSPDPVVAVGDAPDWSEMVDATAGMPSDDVGVAVSVRAGAAEGFIEDLSRAERAELLRLLAEAMEGGS